MRRALAIAAIAASAVACSGAAIPDHIPPAPPKRLTVVVAPSTSSDEPIQDGFGGDGFGGVTPTLDVEVEAEVETTPDPDEVAAEDPDATPTEPPSE